MDPRTEVGDRAWTPPVGRRPPPVGRRRPTSGWSTTTVVISDAMPKDVTSHLRALHASPNALHGKFAARIERLLTAGRVVKGMGDTAMSDGTISDDEEFEIRKAAMSIFSRCVFYLDPNSRLTTLSPADEAKSDFADASTHELAQTLTDCGGTVLTGTGALPVVRLRGVCTQPRWRVCVASARAPCFLRSRHAAGAGLPLASVRSLVHCLWRVR